jgi:hypothetical protein
MFTSNIQKGLMIVAFYCLLLIIIPLGMNHYMGEDGFKNGVRSSLVISLILFEFYGKNMLY